MTGSPWVPDGACFDPIDEADLDTWIKQEFTGYGAAIRRREDAPIPGEPYMSMDIAKVLTRRAVAHFVNKKLAHFQSRELAK